MKKYILTTVLLCVFCLIMSYSAQVLATEVSEPITDDTALDTMETTSEEKFTPQWIKKGKYYYYQQSDGSILQDSGIVKIGKYKYCLGKNGKRLSGVNKVNGKLYYCNPKNGRLVEKVGWKKIKGKKYYIQKGGVLATGVKKIGKVQYGFTTKGVIRGFSKPFKYNGKYYRTNKKGVAENLSNMQVRCSDEAIKYINKYTSSNMSNKKKLRCLYNILITGNYVTGYIDRKEVEAKGFQYRIAYKVLSNNGKYNCYGFACTFASFAKELGYEPYVIVMEEDHAVVMIDGKYYDNMGGRFGVNEPALSNFKIYKKVKF